MEEATGWQTIAKLIERAVNSTPLGFYYHQTGGQNPLLRVLTPNNLKLITMSDRAPVGLFNIPNKPEDIIDKIQEKYEMWYHVWTEQYFPLIISRSKWPDKEENLKPDDVVYFKLTESEMSADWRIGKVEATKLGRDGCVREVTIAYKDTSSDDPSDWSHRSVDRPVRNIVKILNIDETCLMDDINAIHKHAEEVLNKQKLSYEEDEAEPVEVMSRVNAMQVFVGGVGDRDRVVTEVQETSDDKLETLCDFERIDDNIQLYLL